MTVYLYDTFTDTNGTLLTAHTMDIGGGWTKQNSAQGGAPTYSIQSNQSQPGSGLYGVYTADATVADGTLTVDLPVFLSATNNYIGGVVVRWTDTSHYWFIVIEQDGFGYYLAIYQENGSATTRASTNFVSNPNGTTVTLTIVLSGTTISATTNTGENATYSSATQGQTDTLMGLWSYDDTHSYTPGAPQDNFKFEVAGGGGGN